MAAVTVHNDFRDQTQKTCHCFHFFPLQFAWSDWTRCHDLSFFFKLSFNPAFTLSSFTLTLFMGFARQEYRSGLPFPSAVDHILSDLSTMTRPSWVALCGMAHSFIELDKLWSMWLDWLVFCDCDFQSICHLMEKDKRLMKAFWWERLTSLALMGMAMLSKYLIQFSVDGWGYVPSLFFDLRPNYGGGS